MAEESMALQQFRINMLNQGGSGFDTGASSGASFMEINGAFSELRPPSLEGMKKNIQTSFGKIGESLVGAFKGFGGQVSLSNLGLLGPQLQLPHGFIASSAKIPGGLASSKGV